MRFSTPPAPAPDGLADPARLHLLAETGLAAAAAAARLPTLDRVARLAARIARAPVAQVNLVSADAQIPAAAWVDATAAGPHGRPLDAADAAPGGAWRTPVGLDASYCQHVVRGGAPLVVDDAAADPLLGASRATADGGIGAYAAVPLTTPDGTVLGSVCVVDFHARRWTADDLAALAECAALAGEEVAARLGAAHALRAIDARLQLALEAAWLGTWALDLATMTLTTSACCRAAFGRAADDGAAFAWADLRAAVHPDDRPALDDALRRAATGGEAVRVELRVAGPDGAPRALVVHGRAVTDAAGAPVRVEGITQDLTAQRAAEREASAARAAAAEASRAKGDFLTLMSHELRTPLNAIEGYAELLELGIRGPITDQQRDDLRRIRASQRHLLGLVNQVLNYATLESGRLRLTLAPVPLREALDELAALVAPAAQAKGLALSFDACRGALAAIADGERLRQILLNLLANAIRFTDAGGRVDVRCAARGDRLQVVVADTGVGIPADRQAAIFEPFVQAAEGLARPFDGAGLGLAISRDLARAMGGDVTVASAPGAGAAFTLELPRAPASPAPAPGAGAGAAPDRAPSGGTDDDLDAVARIGAVPTILRVISEVTGLRLALVARVTPDEWRACAVLDRMGFGLAAGDRLDVATTLCSEVRDSRQPILIEHASAEPAFCAHPTPQRYGFESYIAVPILRPDGSYFGNVCALDAEPARLREPRTLAMMELFAELIGQQLSAEEASVRDRAALSDERQTAELREQFIAVLGHDLRTPLAAVLAGSGVLLERGGLDPMARTMIERIHGSGRRMARLIDDIMDFARGRLGGGMPVAREPVDVGALVAQVVAEIASAHPARTLRVAAADAGTARLDVGRTAQMLSNLVSNAVEHGAPDAPVTVAATRDGAQLRLTVTSRGRPIPPEVAARLFQPYVRAQGARPRTGLGLGLYIASEIARAHGGSIAAASDAEGATTFTVELPVGG